MSKFEVGEMVDNAADVHEGGTVMAVFPTVDGSCDDIRTDGGAGGCTPRAGKVGPRRNPGPYFF